MPVVCTGGGHAATFYIRMRVRDTYLLLGFVFCTAKRGVAVGFLVCVHGAVYFCIGVWLIRCRVRHHILSVQCCDDENIHYREVAWLHCRYCEPCCCLVCPIHFVCF